MGAKKRVTDPAGNPWPEHPLFPVEEGAAPPEVGWIQVTRFEPGKGQVWSSKLFRPEELASTEALYMLYGGGDFELIARGKDPTSGNATTITKKQPWKLDGPSRPLFEVAKDQATPPAAAPAAMPSSAFGNDGGLFAFMAQQAQQQHALQLAQMQQQGTLQIEAIKAQAVAAQAQTQMMIAMMQGQKHEAPPQQNTAELIAAIASIMKKDPEEASGLDVLKAGIELGTKMKDGGGGSLEEIMQTVAAAGSVIGPMLENEKASKELERARIQAGITPEKKAPSAGLAIVPSAPPPKADAK